MTVQISVNHVSIFLNKHAHFNVVVPIFDNVKITCFSLFGEL